MLTLHQSHQAFLRALQDFVRYNVSKDITDYTLVTSNDFDTYYIDVYNLYALNPAKKVITVSLYTITLTISTQVVNSKTIFSTL